MSYSGSCRCPANAPPHPSLVEAIRYWLLLGCISFGGPAGQIGLMHRELVERKRWICAGRFLPGRLAGAISAAVALTLLVRYDWGVLRLIGLAALTGLSLHALTLIA
ncbi:MAG: chromate transporter [Pseudomonas sp.]